MEHSEEFLRKLCDGKVIGDFYPFKMGNQREVVEYIKKSQVACKIVIESMLNPILVLTEAVILHTSMSKSQKKISPTGC